MTLPRAGTVALSDRVIIRQVGLRPHDHVDAQRNSALRGTHEEGHIVARWFPPPEREPLTRPPRWWCTGVVYVQDLESNVMAISLATGKVLWRHAYNSPNGGPDGVTVARGVVYGATNNRPFAFDRRSGSLRV